MIKLIKKLIEKLLNKSEVLYINGGLIFYKRESLDESIYIYVNNSTKQELLNLNAKYQSCITDKIFENKLVIKPYSFEIFNKIK